MSHGIRPDKNIYFTSQKVCCVHSIIWGYPNECSGIRNFNRRPIEVQNEHKSSIHAASPWQIMSFSVNARKSIDSQANHSIDEASEFPLKVQFNAVPMKENGKIHTLSSRASWTTKQTTAPTKHLKYSSAQFGAVPMMPKEFHEWFTDSCQQPNNPEHWRNAQKNSSNSNQCCADESQHLSMTRIYFGVNR